MPLTERDLADLERLRGQTPERDALRDLSGIRTESVTEAALLHAIFTAGLRAVRERAEELAHASAAAGRLASGEAEQKPPPKAERPAMVPLGAEEVMTGWVSCDDNETLYDDEVRADVGVITVPAMRRVEVGLRAALGMTD